MNNGDLFLAIYRRIDDELYKRIPIKEDFVTCKLTKRILKRGFDYALISHELKEMDIENILQEKCDTSIFDYILEVDKTK